MLFASAALPAADHQLVGLCTGSGFRMVEVPVGPGQRSHKPDCALACHAAMGERRRGRA
jgi:hypothetical protein